MLEFFEVDDSSGTASVYDSHITLSKTLLKYFKDAYRVRLGVDRETDKVYLYTINKDYALSGELNEASLLKVSISKTYARVCSKSAVNYISDIFHFVIEKKKFKRFKAWYDKKKNVIVIDMKGEIA